MPLPPAEYPCLLATSEELAAAKARAAAQPWAKKIYDKIIAAADAALDDPVEVPDKGGQWSHWYSCPTHGRHLKGEGPTPIFVVRDCDDVQVLGYGGNAIPPAGESLLLFERTPNFLVANLVDRPMGIRGDPTSWHALIEHPTGGPVVTTTALDRPVVYRRGRPAR